MDKVNSQGLDQGSQYGDENDHNRYRLHETAETEQENIDEEENHIGFVGDRRKYSFLLEGLLNCPFAAFYILFPRESRDEYGGQFQAFIFGIDNLMLFPRWRPKSDI